MFSPEKKRDQCQPRLGFPNLGLGLGLRSSFFDQLLHQDPPVDWFEIISENFIDDQGYARHVLRDLAAKVPIVMHGVSLSIGSTDPLNINYINSLKRLADEIEAVWISDHLCWTGVAGYNTHDLMPMPLTQESLDHVAARVHHVQELLGRPLIIENPSTYLQYQHDTMTEWAFLSALVQRTGCGLLLDVNNVFVSAHNHKFSEEAYILNLPHHAIVQVHLAGPTYRGDLMIDTHDQGVPFRVWQLYSLVQTLTGGVSTLLEWDSRIPPLDELVTELNKANQIMAGRIPTGMKVNRAQNDAVSNPVDFVMGTRS